MSISLKFDDEDDFNQIIEEIRAKVFRKKKEEVIDLNYRYQLKSNEPSIEDLMDYEFERMLINGKEKVVMILPSKMNKE